MLIKGENKNNFLLLMDILSNMHYLSLPMKINMLFKTAIFLEENRIDSYFLPAIIINFIPSIVGNLILKNFNFNETLFHAILIGLPLIFIARKNIFMQKISACLSFVGRVNSLIQLGKNHADIYTLVGYHVVTGAVGKYYRNFFMHKPYIYSEEEIFQLCFSIFMIGLNHYTDLENNMLFVVNFLLVLLSTLYVKYKYSGGEKREGGRRSIFKKSK